MKKKELILTKVVIKKIRGFGYRIFYKAYDESGKVKILGTFRSYRDYAFIFNKNGEREMVNCTNLNHFLKMVHETHQIEKKFTEKEIENYIKKYEEDDRNDEFYKDQEYIHVNFKVETLEDGDKFLRYYIRNFEGKKTHQLKVFGYNFKITEKEFNESLEKNFNSISIDEFYSMTITPKDVKKLREGVFGEEKEEEKDDSELDIDVDENWLDDTVMKAINDALYNDDRKDTSNWIEEEFGDEEKTPSWVKELDFPNPTENTQRKEETEMKSTKNTIKTKIIATVLALLTMLSIIPQKPVYATETTQGGSINAFDPNSAPRIEIVLGDSLDYSFYAENGGLWHILKDGSWVFVNEEKRIYEFAPASMGDWSYELDNLLQLSRCVSTYLENTQNK